MPKFRLSHTMSINITPALNQQIIDCAAALNISKSKVAVRVMRGFIERPTFFKRPKHLTATTPAPTRSVSFTWTFPLPKEREQFELAAKVRSVTVTTLLRQALYEFTKPYAKSQEQLIEAASDAWET